MTRDEALKLIKENVNNKNLIKHMLATEAAMKALAERLDGDIEKWGMAGLLHDIDYDQTLDNFPKHGLISAQMLEKEGVEPEIIQAVRAHPAHRDFPPESAMDLALHSVDGLTGLIVSATLMHPQKKLKAVDTGFVLRRFGEKRFSANVDREQIKRCSELDLELEEFVDITLKAMQSISEELGL